MIARRGSVLAIAILTLSVTACGAQPGAPAPSGQLSTGMRQAALPDRARRDRTLIVATSTPYAPNEFIDDTGQPAGFDIDVITAIGKALDVRIDVRDVPFADLVPGVARGDYDIATRSLFDTVAREASVDMVTYFSAGTLWAQRAGGSVDPNLPCGHTVAAQVATVQFDAELTAKNLACTNAGRPAMTVVAFGSQADAIAALTRGDVDAVSADSPVTSYSVRQSGGRLAAAGAAFDTEPYGMAVAKGSPLGPLLQQRIQVLIDSGGLAAIADRWGVGQGAVQHSTINGATG
ncbi:transporter substrate-binding domain-containing protein [Nocardia sp. NPDC052254]|uniref:transporter substrate-binding domain-containing protein n=1 Tax=Nocardia sp. NPDC052254 TaxID=3155681 RepID=UPI0034293A91